MPPCHGTGWFFAQPRKSVHILGASKKRPLESPRIPKVALVVFTSDWRQWWYRNDNVILSSDKRVIMKIVTSAQVMYYFTSAKHEWNNTLRVHKWLFSLSRVYPTTITLSYYLFNNCFKYNFHYLWGWQWMNSLSPLVMIMNSLSPLVMIMTLFSKFTVISRNF